MDEKRNGIGIDDHRELAERIAEIHRNVGRIRSVVTEVYGEPARSMTHQISQSLEALRSYLDTRVFLENPDRDGMANAAVYYAGGRRGCGGEGGGPCGGRCQGGSGSAPCAGGGGSGCQND
jgi:hypothetical protein